MENLCAQGAYEIAPAEGEAKISLFASGSEIEIAMAARDLLKAQGHGARVSCRCLASSSSSRATRPRGGASSAKRRSASPSRPASARGGTPSSAIEGAFIGMHSFGASGKYKEVYAHFGITAENVAAAAVTKLAARR